MCRSILAAIAVFSVLATAVPASAFTFSENGETELPRSELQDLRLTGSYHRLWMQPERGDTFYKLCAWAHDEPYVTGRRPSPQVIECVCRQAELAANAWIRDIDIIYPDEWYRIALTSQEFQNVLAHLESASDPLLEEPAWLEEAWARIAGTDEAVEALDDRIDALDNGQKAIVESIEDLAGRLDQHGEQLDALRQADQEAAAERQALTDEVQSLSNRVGERATGVPTLPGQGDKFGADLEKTLELVKTHWQYLLIAFLVLVIFMFVLEWLSRRNSGSARNNGPDQKQPDSQAASEPAQSSPPPSAPAPAGARTVTVTDAEGETHPVLFEPGPPDEEGRPRFVKPGKNTLVHEDYLHKHAKDYLASQGVKF